MNQDQIKAKLCEIMKPAVDFTLVLSGKASKKVNGLYYPEKKEIVLHNRNFNKADGTVDDNLMMYTAIHEFAHHIRAIRDGFVKSQRPHDNEFKMIFEQLLAEARKKGIYTDSIFGNEEFTKLTKKLRDEYLTKNAALMKEFGGLLLEAHTLCLKYNARFEDYVERELKLKMSEASSLMKVHSMDLDPELGLDNMKMVSRINNSEKREAAENKLLGGEGVETVKSEFLQKPKPDNVVERLFAEKEEIERRITSLKKKLEQIEQQIDIIDKQANG